MKSRTLTERLHFHFSLSCIGEGNGNPLQCSCLENPRDGRAWWAAVYGVAQSQTWLKRLSSSSRFIPTPGCTYFFLSQDTSQVLILMIFFFFLKKHRYKVCVCAQLLSHIWLCNPMDCGPPGSSVHGILQTRVGCHGLLQGTFSTQGLNLHLLHCRWILYCWATQQ